MFLSRSDGCLTYHGPDWDKSAPSEACSVGHYNSKLRSIYKVGPTNYKEQNKN